MPQVLFRRPFRTPLEHFPPSRGGKSSTVSEEIIEKHGLPPDAKVLDEDYVPPAEQPQNYETVDDTAAKVEVEVAKRVEEELAKREAIERAKQVTAEAQAADDEEEGDLLDGNVASITSRLDELEADQLEDLLAREKTKRKRKGVIVAIEAALEEFD